MARGFRLDVVQSMRRRHAYSAVRCDRVLGSPQLRSQFDTAVEIGIDTLDQRSERAEEVLSSRTATRSDDWFFV